MNKPQKNENMGFGEIAGILYRRIRRKSRRFFKRTKIKIKKAAKKTGPPVYMIMGIGCIILMIAITLLVWNLTRKNAYDILIGEEVVATVKINKKVTAESLTASVDAKLLEKTGVKTRLDSAISINERHAKRSEMIADTEILSKLLGKITYQVEASAINIDGRQIAVVKDSDTVSEIKARLVEPYTQGIDGELVSADFQESFNEEKRFVSAEDITSSELAVERLSGVTETEMEYIVASGDSMGAIAAKFNTSIKEICEKNNILEENAHELKVGQSLSITQPKPFLSVVVVTKSEFEEIIEPERVTQQNPSLPASYTKVLQQAKPGKQSVIIHTTRVNGVKISEDRVGSNIIEAPQSEIIEVGTGS